MTLKTPGGSTEGEPQPPDSSLESLHQLLRKELVTCLGPLHYNDPSFPRGHPRTFPLRRPEVPTGTPLRSPPVEWTPHSLSCHELFPGRLGRSGFGREGRHFLSDPRLVVSERTGGRDQQVDPWFGSAKCRKGTGSRTATGTGFWRTLVFTPPQSPVLGTPRGPSVRRVSS